MAERDRARRMLFGVKLLHTGVWAIFATAILAIPIATMTDHTRLTLWLSALVMVEAAILILNGMRCPLSDVASRYTTAPTANFDIFLPAGLARNNKLIFGLIFLAGELWLISRTII